MKPVWIVDDDQAIRWVLEKALAQAGVPTRSFSQSADVLEALSRETPVALVSDIRMPGGNGLELLRQPAERHPGLPVIVMSASPTWTAPCPPSRAARSTTWPSRST